MTPFHSRRRVSRADRCLPTPLAVVVDGEDIVLLCQPRHNSSMHGWCCRQTRLGALLADTGAHPLTDAVGAFSSGTSDAPPSTGHRPVTRSRLSGVLPRRVELQDGDCANHDAGEEHQHIRLRVVHTRTRCRSYETVWQGSGRSRPWQPRRRNQHMAETSVPTAATPIPQNRRF